MLPPIHPQARASLMKYWAGALVDSMPLTVSMFVARHAALAPPSLKIPIFERVCCRIARNIVEHVELETNMGISSRLRCQLPTTKAQYLFGRPENNIPERSTCELVRRLSADCSHFLDVGANEGLFTLVVGASGGKKPKLHFFEPDQTLFNRLSRNLKVNGIEAEGNALAAARRSGQATFYRNLDDDASGSIIKNFVKGHQTRPELVHTVSLDDYFAIHRIEKAIVKIDVEGAGADVWSGSKKAAATIEYLVIEIVGPEAKSHLPAKIMSETGWHGYYIQDFNLRHSARGEFSYVHPFWNWLFCRLSPPDLAERLARTKFHVLAAN
jgi:FkbM family methyltransferase